MQENLCVRSGPELTAQRLELRAELDKVVNFPIEREPQTVVEHHGLVPSRGPVDDRETAVRERDGPTVGGSLRDEAAVIRASM
jgi:hypothetical protein